MTLSQTTSSLLIKLKLLTLAKRQWCPAQLSIISEVVLLIQINIMINIGIWHMNCGIFLARKQCCKTDIYLVGYVFKHAAGSISYEPIVELGRMMKHQDVTMRISLQNCVHKLKQL